MQEDKNHIDYFQLIPRYLSGNANDSEVKLLEEWVLSSTENKTQFNAFKNAWILSGLEKNDQHIDVEQEWQATADHLFPKGKIVSLSPKTKARRTLLIRMTAAAAILLLVSIGLFQWLNKDNYLEVIALDDVSENQLPDGTQISLNQFASVKYRPGIDKKQRRLELSGDAFFEVERDTARPFVITTQNIKIEVLGTAFYVDARVNLTQIQVIVQSGSVAVTAGSKKITLSANEIGIYDKTTGGLIKKQNENVNYMAWKTGLLVFEGTDLESVVFDLNRKFHSNISIANPTIKACRLKATYENQSLEAIVKIIEKTLNIEAKIEGEKIVFLGQRCN